MKKQDFVHGSLILAASAAAAKIMGALFRIPLAGLLGGTGMGYFSCAYGIFLPVYAVTASGLPSAVARVVSADIGLRGGASLARIKRTALLLFGGAGIAGMVLIAAGAYPFCRFAVGNMPALPAVLMIAPSVAAGCLSSVLRGYYEGMRDMYPTALSQAAEAMIKLICGLAGAKLVLGTASENPALFLRLIHYTGAFPDSEALRGMAVSFAAAAGCAGVTLSGIAGLIFMVICDIFRRNDDITAEVRCAPLSSSAIVRELAAVAVPAAMCALVTNITSLIDLATVMNSLKRAADRFPEAFAGYGVSAAEVPNFFYGCFSGLAVTVFNLVPSVTNMFGRSMMPEAAAAHARGDRKALGKCAADILYITAAAAVPCGIGMSVLARPILGLLFSGSPAEVDAAWRPLAAMGTGMILLCLSSSLFTVFQAAERADIPVKLMAAGAAVKAAGNLLLVPVVRLNTVGAAISTDISYAVIFTGAVWALGRTADVKRREIFSVLAGFLFCGGICGAAAHLAYSLLKERASNGISAVGAVFCGAFFYIISTYLSGIIGKTTLKMTISEKKFKKT